MCSSFLSTTYQATIAPNEVPGTYEDSGSSPSITSSSSSATSTKLSHMSCDAYFPLWRHLIEGDFKGDASETEAASQLQIAILTEFFNSTLLIVGKLNLKTAPKDDDAEG